MSPEIVNRYALEILDQRPASLGASLESNAAPTAGAYAGQATKTLSVREPLLRASSKEGDSVAVLTIPDSNDALIVLTGVTLSKK